MAYTHNKKLVVTLLVIIGLAALGNTVARAQDVLPRPPQPFKGKIGRTVKDSTPDFPKEVSAPQGAPNILLIMTDDVGFAASSPFGGPIPTPTFERLAAKDFTDLPRDILYLVVLTVLAETCASSTRPMPTRPRCTTSCIATTHGRAPTRGSI